MRMVEYFLSDQAQLLAIGPLPGLANSNRGSVNSQTSQGLDSSMSGANSPRPPRPPRVSPRNSISSATMSPRSSHRLDSDADSVIDLTVGWVKESDSRRGSKSSAVARLSRVDYDLGAVGLSDAQAKGLSADELMSKLQVLQEQYPHSELELSASDDEVTRTSDEPDTASVVEPAQDDVDTQATASPAEATTPRVTPLTPPNTVVFKSHVQRFVYREPVRIRERRPSDLFAVEWPEGGCTMCGFRFHRRWASLIQEQAQKNRAQSPQSTVSMRSTQSPKSPRSPRRMPPTQQQQQQQRQQQHPQKQQQQRPQKLPDKSRRASQLSATTSPASSASATVTETAVEAKRNRFQRGFVLEMNP